MSIRKAIQGSFFSADKAYLFILKKLVNNKYKLLDDSKIAFESKCFIEIDWKKNSNKILINKKGMSLNKYSGDSKNKEIFINECNYYFDTLFRSNKIKKILAILTRTPDSKKAIINLMESPKPKNKKIPPCMTCIVFRILNGRLDMQCHMRANNAYRLLSMNLLINEAIHHKIATCLGLEIGNYYHIVDSVHIYREELNEIKQFLK